MCCAVHAGAAGQVFEANVYLKCKAAHRRQQHFVNRRDLSLQPGRFLMLLKHLSLAGKAPGEEAGAVVDRPH